MRLRSLLLPVAVCLPFACSESPTTQESSATTVLFIGNSLTYANDLPRTTAGLALSIGVAMEASDVSRGNTALIDYFHDNGAVLRAIDEGSWDYVVLQQGPTWPGLCRDTLVMAATMFAQRIRAKGATPLLLMPWASRTEMQYLGGVHAAYAEAATAANAVFIPAGEAWRIALESDASLPLYDSDNYHPAPLGTYLTSLVVYERLTGRDARELPTDVIVGGSRLSIPESRVRLLQEAAHLANNAIAPQRTQGAGGTIAAATC